MDQTWDVDEAKLRSVAEELRAYLGLDSSLSPLGNVFLVGAGALRVMVARDLDITVVVPALSAGLVQEVGSIAGQLSTNPRVREVLTRNDTGGWNVDPQYPDGLYLRVEAAGSDGEIWSIDIWFVDEPDRQPDLLHLETLAPLISPATQSKILAIKRAQRWVLPDGSRMPSVEIYLAVLHDAVSNPDEFRAHMGDRIRL